MTVFISCELEIPLPQIIIICNDYSYTVEQASTVLMRSVSCMHWARLITVSLPAMFLPIWGLHNKKLWWLLLVSGERRWDVMCVQETGRFSSGEEQEKAKHRLQRCVRGYSPQRSQLGVDASSVRPCKFHDIFCSLTLSLSLSLYQSVYTGGCQSLRVGSRDHQRFLKGFQGFLN